MYTKPERVTKQDNRTVGERWHEQAERENPVVAGLVFFLAMMAIIGCLFIFPDGAEAKELATGAVSTQSTSASQLKAHVKFTQDKVKAANKAIKALDKWDSYLTKTQVNNYRGYIVKLLDSKTKTAVDKWKKKCSNLDSFAKWKKGEIGTAQSILSKWKGELTSAQKSKFESWIKAIKKAGTKKAINGYKAKYQVMLAPIEKLVNWTNRVNAYLSGTPMAGTGRVIVQAALEHNMDPRLYPAIAYVESKCGVAPYGNPYNVCGWVWNPPYMSSWQDAAEKWHSYFKAYFGSETYPISSMHGYGGYGPWYVNEQMAKI